MSRVLGVKDERSTRGESLARDIDDEIGQQRGDEQGSEQGGHDPPRGAGGRSAGEESQQ